MVGKTRRWLASELIHELTVIDKKIKVAKQELTELVGATGSRLLELHSIGPSGAARLLGDIGDITRFASRAHFASWNGQPIWRYTPSADGAIGLVAVTNDNGLVTSRCVRGVVWTAGVLGGLVLIGMGVFFVRSGLEDSDRWASVFGAFLNVIGLVISGYSALLARRSLSPPREGGGTDVENAIDGGQFVQAVVQARDVHGLHIGPPDNGPAASRPGGLPTPTPGAGNVSNRIGTGTFLGPVVQGRDLSGLSLHLPAASTPSTSGGNDPAAGPPPA